VLTTYLTFQIFKNSLPKSPPTIYYSNGANKAPGRGTTPKKALPLQRGSTRVSGGRGYEIKKNSTQSSIVNHQSSIRWGREKEGNLPH
jgi:hypothetical protein